jgi:uncharacterized protein with HXXEE motif
VPAVPVETHRAVRRLFAALIGAQLLHSVEEYFTGLYDVFPPARFISGLFTSDLRLGFAVFNAALVALGVWCYVRQVRPNRPGASGWAWFWAVLEMANGVGHLALAAIAGSYYPGSATAPLLLALATLLAYRLVRVQSRSNPA